MPKSSVTRTSQRLTIPPFRPHRWLWNGHLQTIAAAWGPQPPPQTSQSARTSTFLLDVDSHNVSHNVRANGASAQAAGDQLVVHDDAPDGWQTGEDIAILMHGLGGCHRSSYMSRLQRRLGLRRVRTWRVDQRGFGASVQCRGLGHAGRHQDVQAAVLRAAHDHPGSRIFLFGFSMGGNLVLNAVGHWSAQSRTPPPLDEGPEGQEGQDQHQRPRNLSAAPDNLVAVAAVAPPMDLLHCARQMQSGWGRWYGRRFVTRLMKSLRQRQQVGLLPDLPDGQPLQLTRWPRDLFHLDDMYTAPLSGFANAEAYYAIASSKPWLPHITIPTLILGAHDDPIVPAEVFETSQSAHGPQDFDNSTMTDPPKVDAEHPYVQTHLIDHGGHVGYFSRGDLPNEDRCWLDWRLLDWHSMHDRSIEAMEAGK